jgi:HAMP domain-containing protein
MSLKKITIVLVAFVSAWSTAQNSRLADLVTEFEMDTWALQRTYTVDESEEYYQRFLTFYSNWENKMNTIDFASLSQQG